MFFRLKFKNPAFWLAEITFVFKHVHAKLHGQIVALIDMKLHEQNHFTSLLDIQVLHASFGIPGHAWPHPTKLT